MRVATSLETEVQLSLDYEEPDPIKIFSTETRVSDSDWLKIVTKP